MRRPWPTSGCRAIKKNLFPWRVMKTHTGEWMWGFLLHSHSAQPGRQRCQLYAPAALYPLGKFLGTRFCERLSGPQNEQVTWKFFKDRTGNRTRNLPSFGAVPQPTAPLAASFKVVVLILSSATISIPGYSYKDCICGSLNVLVCLSLVRSEVKGKEKKNLSFY